MGRGIHAQISQATVKDMLVKYINSRANLSTPLEDFCNIRYYGNQSQICNSISAIHLYRFVGT